MSREFLNWITSLPCIICGSPGVVHDDGEAHVAPCHIKSRGSGGKDEGNVVPMCYKHHNMQHNLGWKRFQKRYKISADEIAQAFLEQWKDQ